METYKLRFHIFLIFILSLLLSSGFVIFVIYTAFQRPEHLTDIAFIIAFILLVIVSGAPIVLTTTYFLEDFRKSVTVDSENEIIKIENRYGKVEFNKKDLIEVYHVKVDRYNFSRFKCPMYEYLLFVFKEREKLIITNLLCKPEKLISALRINPKMIFKNFPFIDREMGNAFLTTEEFDSKVEEFYRNFQDKTKDELLTICKQQGYASYAKKAARQILDGKSK